MTTALQAITLGILLGITYGLIAMGLSLIFGVIRLANFSHGEFYMIGGYIFVVVAPFLSSVGAIVAAMGGCAGLAWLLHRALLQPRRWSAFSGFSYGHYMLVVTFSVAVVSRSAASAITQGRPRHPGSIASGNISLFGLSFPTDRILVAAIAMCGVGALMAVVKWTDIGRSWRAIAQSPTGAQVVGVNFARSARVGFAFACALAGLAGALLAPQYGVFPGNGATALVLGFSAVVLGGMGSLGGAFLGSVIIGLVLTLCTVYLSPQYAVTYAFVVLLVVLSIKPRGIFGARVRSF